MNSTFVLYPFVAAVILLIVFEEKILSIKNIYRLSILGCIWLAYLTNSTLLMSLFLVPIEIGRYLIGSEKRIHWICLLTNMLVIGVIVLTLIEASVLPHTSSRLILTLSVMAYYGALPFYSLSKSAVKKSESMDMLFNFNPLPLSILLLWLSIHHVHSSVYVSDVILGIGALNALFLALLSYTEKNYKTFLFLISASTLSVMVALTSFYSENFLAGWVLYYGGFVLALAGALSGFSFFEKRYGSQALCSTRGILTSSPFIAYALLACFLSFSNMVLMATIFGEDLMLYQLFRHNIVSAIMMLFIYSVQSFSCMNFLFTKLFGVNNNNFGRMPIQKREMFSIVTILALLILSPFCLHNYLV